MHRESGGSYKISGILKNVYCLPKGDRWYVSGGNPSEISNEKPLTKTIGVDTTTAVKRAQKEAADLAQELKALEKEEHDMEGIVHRHQKEWNRAQKERKANELRISELKETIATLNEEIESSANTEIDTTEYEDEVKVAEEDVQKFKDVQVELKAKIEEKMPEIEDLTKQLKEVTLRNEQVLRDMQEVQKQLTQFQTQQSQNDALVEKHTKKLAQYKLILEKHQEKMDQLAEARADALRQARVIHFKYVQQKELDSDEAISEESLPEPTDAELEGIEPPKIERDCDYCTFVHFL